MVLVDLLIQISTSEWGLEWPLLVAKDVEFLVHLILSHFVHAIDSQVQHFAKDQRFAKICDRNTKFCSHGKRTAYWKSDRQTDRNIENFEQITQWKTTKWKEQWYIKSLLVSRFKIKKSAMGCMSLGKCIYCTEKEITEAEKSDAEIMVKARAKTWRIDVWKKNRLEAHIPL